MDEYRMFGDLLSVAEKPQAVAESELPETGDVETTEPEPLAAGRG
jgi:hypothetical protein